MRAHIAGLVLVGGLAAGVPGLAQTEIDRTLQRVYDTAIMASDIRQVRLLRLLPEAGAGDQATLTALENRLLILREVGRVSTKEPGEDAIAQRRQAWHEALPAETDVPALLARAAMSDQALNGWFRDDLRMAEYMEQRFGRGTQAERTALIAEWIHELRRRANLTGKRT
jgi:hypothetical protein